ncbi:hypothetical protein SKAU_G00331300 [Synaphobranchus kaupii]|uniref:EVA1 domain-containing protein n=1 Tax=Synaphobranchus kaupii TaxID=118154 RepID=A0A9Q1EL85_SYNKA|nr:hypothetical protein SKAU_G00331300 [Synaphobranchus kaupii]
MDAKRKDMNLLSNSIAAYAHIKANPESFGLYFVIGVCFGLVLTLCLLVIRISCKPRIATVTQAPSSEKKRLKSFSEEEEEDFSDEDEDEEDEAEAPREPRHHRGSHRQPQPIGRRAERQRLHVGRGAGAGPEAGGAGADHQGDLEERPARHPGHGHGHHRAGTLLLTNPLTMTFDPWCSRITTTGGRCSSQSLRYHDAGIIECADLPLPAPYCPLQAHRVTAVGVAPKHSNIVHGGLS